jgi:hypothetical protein
MEEEANSKQAEAKSTKESKKPNQSIAKLRNTFLFIAITFSNENSQTTKSTESVVRASHIHILQPKSIQLIPFTKSKITTGHP